MKGKLEYVIGQPMMPYLIDNKVHKLNKKLLLQRINEHDAFDVDLKPSPKDRLQISFQCGEGIEGYVDYGFKFTKAGKWVEEPFDALEWMWRHEQSVHGKIKSALEKSPIHQNQVIRKI